MTAWLDTPAGHRLAWAPQPGADPTVVFVHGFRSDMGGTKALALAAHCAARGQAFVRFDCSGHGASEGRFEAGTLSLWLADVLAVLDHLAGPVVLVGSSMGGWLALLAARARPQQVQGLVLLAPAPDFTRWGLAASLSADETARLARDGRIERPSAYAQTPNVLTAALLDDGERHLLLEAPIPFAGPVRLLHGTADPDVPWQIALRTLEQLTGTDVRLTLVKDGDHRLSRPADLALLCESVDAVLAALAR